MRYIEKLKKINYLGGENGWLVFLNSNVSNILLNDNILHLEILISLNSILRWHLEGVGVP